MQPLKRKQTKTEYGVARARVLLHQDAPWLPGYPVGFELGESSGAQGVRWRSANHFDIDQSPTWLINRERLRTAQMTITKLRHHFPKALPKLVGDVDDWLSRVDCLIELLKRAVHDGAAINAKDVREKSVLPKRWNAEVIRIQAAYPSLAALMDSVTFAALSNDQPCRRESLEWIERHAGPLSVLCDSKIENRCELPMLLLSVREQLPSTLLEPICRGLTDPDISDCRWESVNLGLSQLTKALKKAFTQNGFVLPEAPRGERMSALVRKVLYQIVAQRPKKRQRSFDLLEQVLTPELVNVVAETQRCVSSGEKQMRRALRRIASARDLARKASLATEAWQLIPSAESNRITANAATVNALATSLRGIPGDDADSLAWTRFLAAFPKEHARLRVQLLASWKHRWFAAKNHGTDLRRVINALSSLFQRRGIAGPLLQNWYAYVDGASRYDEFVTDTCCQDERATERLTRAVRLLEKTVYDQSLKLGPKIMASLVDFTQATHDDDLSSSIIAYLSKHPDRNYIDVDIRLAISFGESPDEIARIVVTLADDSDLNRLATDLKPLANVPELRALIAKRLVERDAKKLSQVAAPASILHDLGCTLPTVETHSPPFGWCERYPDEYHPALTRLGEATPNAENIADKVLGKYFPSPKALQDQIDALELKLNEQLPPGIDEARMRRRLANLQHRSVHRSDVSETRRDRLIETLQRRSEEETLERYAQRCRQRAATATSTQFAVREIPHDLLVPPLDRVLREINRLNRRMRTLGIRLLFETLHRTTRNFDDEPRNIAFIESMESIGIRMAPWLSDQHRQSASMADGTPYELAFTRDAVDFLLMGFHFDTCLSPDSFNFFSTVANAVDANKRVVYGKTAAGKVIGRCLFALNDAGEILTYHRYSHDHQDGFSNAVDQFARRLADAMQTSIGCTGNVAKLVANDWYDDGPVGADVNWLGDGGPVRDLIKQVSTECLFAEMVDAFGVSTLRQHVVPLATDEELRGRSRFLTDLLDQFGGELTDRQKFVVGVNVEPAGVRDRLLSELRWSDMIRLVHRHQCGECDVFHGIADYARVFRALTEHSPTLGLRAIRAARPRSIRDDRSDPSKTRRLALAHVHGKLGRQQLAEQLSKKR